MQFVKNVLVKHGWSEERSRDELLKHDPESNERGNTSSFFGSRPGVSGQSQNQRPNNNSQIVRIVSGSTAAPKIVMMKRVQGGVVVNKGGRVRRGSSGSEDDDYGVKKGKDDRVYDRLVCLFLHVITICKFFILDFTISI